MLLSLKAFGVIKYDFPSHSIALSRGRKQPKTNVFINPLIQDLMSECPHSFLHTARKGNFKAPSKVVKNLKSEIQSFFVIMRSKASFEILKLCTCTKEYVYVYKIVAQFCFCKIFFFFNFMKMITYLLC